MILMRLHRIKILPKRFKVVGRMNSNTLFSLNSIHIFFPFLCWPVVQIGAISCHLRCVPINGIILTAHLRKPLTGITSHLMTGAAVAHHLEQLHELIQWRCCPLIKNRPHILIKQRLRTFLVRQSSNPARRRVIAIQ